MFTPERSIRANPQQVDSFVVAAEWDSQMFLCATRIIQSEICLRIVCCTYVVLFQAFAFPKSVLGTQGQSRARHVFGVVPALPFSPPSNH